MLKEFVISLNSVLASVVPADTKPESYNTSKVLSPIVGVWELELSNKVNQQCTEMYNFKADNQLSVVSGEEWTQGFYRILYTDNMQSAKKELPKLVMITQVDDNNTDCSGNKVDQTGDSFIAYFNKVNNRQFKLCSDKLGEACFMTFNKKLPY